MVDIGATRRGAEEESNPLLLLCVAAAHKSERIAGRIEEVQQLLPGIPDEITLDHVAPKLPWTAFHRLASVSRGWEQAINSRQVYAARVRTQSTQTLVALSHRHLNVNAISLFSVNDSSCLRLPAIPGFNEGIPRSCQCVALDGKLYILGGLKESTTCSDLKYKINLTWRDPACRDPACADVHVLDVAGQRKWKQCASMADPREKFGCGVIGGKIYVFGGTSQDRPVCGCEVYDPEEDVWSPIAGMTHFRFNQKVTAVGEELFVHNGEYYDMDFDEWAKNRVLDDSRDDDRLCFHILDAYSAQVYHPVKDNYRIVKHFIDSDHTLAIFLMIKGKLHAMSWYGLEVYDTAANSLKPSQDFSFGVIGHIEDFEIDLLAGVAVDDELLAIVEWTDLRESFTSGPYGICLMRSRGLGHEKKEIVWEKIQCSLSFGSLLFMCPIGL